MTALLIYTTFSLAYAWFAFWVLRGLKRLRAPYPSTSIKDISVVIAARNEQENISYCLGTLLKQTHPREHLQVIVVDDHSEDATWSLASRVAEKFDAIEVLSATKIETQIAPKKAALTAGIEAAKADVILTLDADCAASPHWVEKMSGYLADNVAAVASWVLIPDEKTLLPQIEFLDAFSLQLIGAAAIGWDKPFLANGANLAFHKKAFLEMGGYQGFADMGSGDDDLFLQKLYKSKKGRIVFATDPDVAVTTFANKSWIDFFQQRIRWSSKTAHYPLWIKGLEGGVFLYYLSLFLGIPLALIWSFPVWIPVAALLNKMAWDHAILRHGLRLLRRSFHWPAFLAASCLHLVYIPVIGLMGPFGHFTWKGRRYVRGKLENEPASSRKKV